MSSTLRIRRADLAFSLGVVGAVAILAWVILTIHGLSQDLRAANDARDALAAQVERLGGEPVAGPPGSRGDVGEPGPPGPPGPEGDPGPPGEPGADGATGPRGTAGDDGADGQDGSEGEPGAPGTDGAAGEDGADGATGPAGPPGPEGDPGPAGPQGEPGEDGQDGDRGPAGPPPSGWTFTGPDGTTYECVPDADGSTHYTCEAASGPGDPTDPGLLSLGALDPARRTY
jgi:hypothetical protein